MRCVLASVLVASAFVGCSNDHRPPPVRSADNPHEAQIDTPKKMETATAYRAKLSHGSAELYLPPWFTPRRGGYDLMVHFHGLGRLQEANIERAQLNVAVVSINLGVGTDPYSNAFRDPQTFQRLLSDTEDEIARSGRAPGAQRRRLALSAWSAGFVSIPRVMSDPQVAERVDAILLADGFFTSFTNIKKRTMYLPPLEKFAQLAQAASQNQKLFAITHTTIPTGDYPSTQEVVGKLLEITSNTKVPSTTQGPRKMHEIYTVDNGSFHVKGYEGVLAADHIDQIRAMGETLYPFLRARWEHDDDAEPAHQAAAAPPPAPAAH